MRPLRPTHQASLNGTLVTWLEPLADLLGKSTNLRMSMSENMVDITTLFEKATLFPLFLGGIGGRQGNLEPLVIYYIARLLAKVNLVALAKYEAREVRGSADELVAEQEAAYVRKAQEEVAVGFGFALLINTVFFFAVSTWILWTLINAGYGYFYTPYDPLAF